VSKLRVEFLEESERRYPGRMTQLFLFRAIGLAIIAIVVLSLAGMVLHVRAMKVALKRTRAAYHRIDPHYQDVRAMQEALADNKKLIEELKTWQKSRVPWHEVLLQFARVVPAQMQIDRINVRETFIMIPPPKWQKDLPPTPARLYKMGLGGRVRGDMADAIVVSFIRTLRTGEAFKEFLDTVKLQRLQRAPGLPPGQEGRVFAVEVASVPRKME